MPLDENFLSQARAMLKIREIAEHPSLKILPSSNTHDDVIKWKHYRCCWPFVRGIHRSQVDSHHKGQWRGALMFSLICAWTNGCVNNRDTSDLRHHRAHYDVTVMDRNSWGLFQYPIRHFNSSWPSDTICRHRSGSTLAQVMVRWLMAPGHYLNQSWHTIS